MAKSGIHIKASHKGLLTRKVGKSGLKSSALKKTISQAKKAGNVKLEKQAVFAENAKKWNHGNKHSAKSRTGKRKSYTGA